MSFAVPLLLRGPLAEVRGRVATALRRFEREGGWKESFAGDRVDAADAGGLIVLDGPAPLLGRDPHLQLFLPFKLLVDKSVGGRIQPERLEEAIAESCTETWSTLGLLSPAARLLVLPPDRRPMLIQAALRAWPDLEAAGPRYSVGLNEGREIKQVDTNLPYLLAQAGVPESALMEPYPPGGPAALLARYSPNDE